MLWYSLNRSDGCSQTQEVSKSAAVAAGRDLLAVAMMIKIESQKGFNALQVINFGQ